MHLLLLIKKGTILQLEFSWSLNILIEISLMFIRKDAVDN